MTPVKAHANSKRKGLPTWREMSALTMKMPLPTMEPMTNIVESKRLSDRCMSLFEGVVACIDFKLVTDIIVIRVYIVYCEVT
jgi:hypothetical protein